MNFYRLVARGRAGLCCDEQGVALGPFPLVTCDTGKTPAYRLRPRKDIARALRTGWRGMIPEIIDHVAEGLERVTEALNDGDHVRASILAVQMRVPGLLPSALPKLAKAAGLKKYNPNWDDEARVPVGDPDGGQWTGDGSDATDGNPQPVQIAENNAGAMSDAGGGLPTAPDASLDKDKYVVLNDGTKPKDPGDKSGPTGGNPRDIAMIKRGFDDYNAGKIVPLPTQK